MKESSGWQQFAVSDQRKEFTLKAGIVARGAFYFLCIRGPARTLVWFVWFVWFVPVFRENIHWAAAGWPRFYRLVFWQKYSNIACFPCFWTSFISDLHFISADWGVPKTITFHCFWTSFISDLGFISADWGVPKRVQFWHRALRAPDLQSVI